MDERGGASQTPPPYTTFKNRDPALPEWTELWDVWKTGFWVAAMLIVAGLLRVLFRTGEVLYHSRKHKSAPHLFHSSVWRRRKRGTGSWLFASLVKMRERVRTLFEREKFFMLYLPYIRILVSSAVCVLYVAATYWRTVPLLLARIEMLVGILLFLRLVLKFIVSNQPLLFACSADVIIECFSLVSLMQSRPGLWLNWNFFQMVRVVKLWSELDHRGLVLVKYSKLQRFYVKLAIQVAGFIYVVASGAQLFELMGDPAASIYKEMYAFNWANSLYFTVITITTVGFGDFEPGTLLGRLAVIAIIVMGVFLVSRSVTQAVEVSSSLRMGMGTYAKSATEHVVLGGAPRFRLVQKFLDEFYSFPEHYNTHVVLLCNARDWLDDEWLSLMNSNAHLQKQCVYLEGSLSNLRDLERAQVADALCVFIMCDTAAEIAYREESEVTMSILSVRAFAGRIPVYALCLVRESVLQVNIALSERQQDNDDEYGVALCGSGDLQVRLERLSASFCHQVITWTLVTESLFSNGLSTLVANLVREDKPKPDLADLPWQIEYKVGASVRLAYAVVPRALDGMRYFSLASVLNDFGVVLLAMQRDPDEQDWEPMRTTSVLEHGRVLICFTFHPKEVISAILESAANFIARQHSEQGLSDTDSNASDHGQNELGSAGASVHHHHPSDLYDLIFGGDQIDFELATEHFDPIAGFHGSAADISSHSSGSDVATATPQSVTAPPPNKSATIASHASAVIADILREKASGTFAYGSSTASRTPSKTVAKDLSMAELVDIRRKAKLLYINQALPVELSGHIVICFSQRREMRNNLDYILTSIWQDRPAFHATRVPIVVVCAEFPAGIDHMYHRFRGILYFVQGNPSSVKTLRYAQYSRSRAIAISAAYAVNVLEADAMNLFTVMVLDFLLETSSKAFVCSLLHSEDSLKFLRPPPRARRRRVHLGEVGEISMHLAESHPAETILAVEEHREGSEAGENAPEGDVYIDSDDEAAPAGGRFGARPLSSPRLIHRTAAISQNLANQRVARTRSLYLLDGGSLDAEDEEEEDDGDFEDGDEGGEEEQRTEFHTQDSDTRHSVEYGRARPPKSQFLTLSRDREAGTCSSRRIVDESSERQRFASGETYIQNLYVATMVREFAQPGIWSFLQLLLGMKTKRKLKKKGNLVANQNWIRLLDIPLAWVEEGELSSGGRTYREVFEKMLEFGCLALGLYRGGGACVRLAISDEQASELNQFIPQSSSASAPAFVEQTPLLTRKRGQYKCKVTGRTTVYEEFPTAGNDLPYVLTSPEPFCQVSNTDGVYVLCHPSSGNSSRLVTTQ